MSPDPSHSPCQVLAVVGPTATGKTALGVRLAKALGSEILSCDSQLVYEGLSIGVAKPTLDEQDGIKHHLMDLVPPTQAFSAGDYAGLARPLLDTMIASGQLPIIVGGTGFYLRSLLQPDHLPTIARDPVFREGLQQIVDSQGHEALHAMLREQDPQRAEALHPNDTVRITRALEIIHATGQPVSPTPTELRYPTRVVGLTYRDRARHIAQIERRLWAMVDEGFLEEVEGLYRTYGRCFALDNAHGYPELIDVLNGERSLEDALTQVAINIRQYSRRQMTWFKTWPDIRWFYVDEESLDNIMTVVLEEFS